MNIKDFNPRAHEGRDQNPEAVADGKVISIHAPMRGATAFTISADCSVYISIHAPMRGATANVQKNHTFAFVIISR